MNKDVEELSFEIAARAETIIDELELSRKIHHLLISCMFEFNKETGRRRQLIVDLAAAALTFGKFNINREVLYESEMDVDKKIAINKGLIVIDGNKNLH